MTVLEVIALINLLAVVIFGVINITKKKQPPHNGTAPQVKYLTESLGAADRAGSAAFLFTLYPIKGGKVNSRTGKTKAKNQNKQRDKSPLER